MSLRDGHRCLLVSLLFVLVVSCASEPPDEKADEPTPEPEGSGAAPAAPPDLRTCPEGDSAWGAAIREATRQETLDLLLVLTEEVAAAYPGRWEPHWARGESLYRLGQVDEAVGAARTSLQLARDRDDPAGVALSSYRLGWIDYRGGEFDQAEEHYLAALAAAERTGRTDLQAQILNGHAGLLVETGRYGEAHLKQEKAVEALRQLGLARYARMASLNRAVVLMRLGDAATSREILEAIYEESERDGDPYVLPRAALTLGTLLRRTNRPEEALQWYERVPDEDAELASLAGLGRGLVAMSLGDLERARQDLDRALEQTTPLHALLVRAHLAEVDLLSGATAEARRRLADVLAEAERTGAEEVAWIAQWIEGRSWLVEGRFDRAAVSLRSATSILDGQGSELDPLEEGLRYLRDRSDVYSDLAAALCGDGLDEQTGSLGDEILSAVERTHARALRHVFRGGGVGPPSSGLAEIRRGLGPRDLLLDFAIGRERGVVLAIRPEGLTARPVAGWDRLAEPLRRYRAALLRPFRSAEARLDPMADLDRSLRHGEASARMLLEPVRPAMDGAERIYVVPDRELALVPFSALPFRGAAAEDAGNGVSFLGDTFEVAVLPLAGAPPPRTAPRPPILLAGDPIPGQESGLPRLAHAGREIDRIREVWGEENSTILREGELRLASLRQSLERGYGTVHLATHAVASTSDPGRCVVYLSQDDRLGLDDIVPLPLDRALVVLSACNTGEGELIPGEGVVGLGWAFLRAGSDAVGVTLWSVDDDSATELMTAFHASLRKGRDPVSALAEARRSLAQRRPHPAHWAPFVLIVRPSGRTGV